MLAGIRNQWQRWRFNADCRPILNTAPVRLDPSSAFGVLSQVQHKDVWMYLLAVKSFCHYLKPASITVVNDGSLTSADLAVLNAHLPGVSIRDIREFASAHCPRGGTWERLLAIASLVPTQYTIQLDCDTLTLALPQEIIDHVQTQTSFVIGTRTDQTIEPMAIQRERSRAKVTGPQAHVQHVAEANFDQLRRYAQLNYVRGCSGFTGFAQASFTRDFLEEISGQMRAAIGEKWHAWGSEQVMSNIAVANAPRVRVLPYPKYSDCTNIHETDTVFVHFIGTCRFTGAVYNATGSRVIQTLQAP